jgi:toxin ParE1/3/4
VKTLVVSAAARRDLTSIARYTEEQWGGVQRQRYMDSLRECLAGLCRSPEFGALRQDLGRGYRSIACGRHAVFYRQTATDIVVIRVLHQRMDVRQLPPIQP